MPLVHQLRLKSGFVDTKVVLQFSTGLSASIGGYLFGTAFFGKQHVGKSENQDRRSCEGPIDATTFGYVSLTSNPLKSA